MRAAADAVVDAGVDAWASERLGAARAERLRRVAADPGGPAFFGPPDTGSETFHIGRRHVRDSSGDPVVIDWRAPMSRPFYQASAADPQGPGRRPRLCFSGRALTRSAGPAPPPPVRLLRRRAHQLRGRAPRGSVAPGAPQPPAARGDRASPQR